MKVDKSSSQSTPSQLGESHRRKKERTDRIKPTPYECTFSQDVDPTPKLVYNTLIVLNSCSITAASCPFTPELKALVNCAISPMRAAISGAASEEMHEGSGLKSRVSSMRNQSRENAQPYIAPFAGFAFACEIPPTLKS